jgi:hypothetical protein
MKISISHTSQFASKPYPNKNENPLLPHPDPSVTSPKTQLAGCLFGVRVRRATHIAKDAKTIIGKFYALEM